MPKMDRTGPMGQGQQTGRGLGLCNGEIKIGWCGCRPGWNARLKKFFHSSKNQLQNLEDEEKILNDQLEIIKAEKAALKNQK